MIRHMASPTTVFDPKWDGTPMATTIPHPIYGPPPQSATMALPKGYSPYSFGDLQWASQMATPINTGLYYIVSLCIILSIYTLFGIVYDKAVMEWPSVFPFGVEYCSGVGQIDLY